MATLYRKVRYGYTDMGRVQIPPRAQYFVLTDRDDGTEWVLSRNGERVSITDVIPDDAGFILRFGAYDGPYLAADPRIRLLVRGGRLGYDYEPLPQGVSDRDQPRVLIRLGTSTTYYEIVIPAGWAPGVSGLGYETEPTLP